MSIQNNSRILLDPEFSRKEFPALCGDWIFMDNAGGSQTLKKVTDRINKYLLTSDVQHGASYNVSQLAMDRVSEAVKHMSTFVNASEPSEIIMGSSTTMLLRILSLCLLHKFRAGDEVIVTNCDHEANIGPWADLEKHGLRVKVWQVNPNTFEMDLKELESLLTNKTRLVAVTHTSNIFGTIIPIKQIAELVHSYGAKICVDGVAHAPHRLIDVKDTNVDFYAFSFYKTFGPHYALLYGKKEILLDIPGINHYFIGRNEVPHKFQPGNLNFELSYGTLGISDYLADMFSFHYGEDKNINLRNKFEKAYDLIRNYEEKLSSHLLDYLKTKNQITIIGKEDPDKSFRVPTISFVVNKTDSESIVLKVDKYNIGIRFGDFYARRLIEFLGLASQKGVVRVSLVHYNTIEEIDKLIEVFERIL